VEVQPASGSRLCQQPLLQITKTGRESNVGIAVADPRRVTLLVSGRNNGCANQLATVGGHHRSQDKAESAQRGRGARKAAKTAEEKRGRAGRTCGKAAVEYRSVGAPTRNGHTPGPAPRYGLEVSALERAERAGTTLRSRPHGVRSRNRVEPGQPSATCGTDCVSRGGA